MNFKKQKGFNRQQKENLKSLDTNSIHSISSKSNRKLSQIAASQNSNKIYDTLKGQLESLETEMYSIKRKKKPNHQLYLLPCSHKDECCHEQQILESDRSFRDIGNLKPAFQKNLLKMQKEFMQQKVIKSERRQLQFGLKDPFNIIYQMVIQDPERFIHSFDTLIDNSDHKEQYKEMKIRFGIMNYLRTNQYYNGGGKILQYEVMQNKKYRYQNQQKSKSLVLCGCQLSCQF